MQKENSFHEVRFPTDIALGSTGGPVRRTEVVTLGSGKEQRNSRWAHSRRQYNAGYGIKSTHDLQSVIEFFEERRGRLYGFRFRDPFDWKSSNSSVPVSALDQEIGIGDGTSRDFQISKRYGNHEYGYLRKISKPVAQTVLIAVDNDLISTNDYALEASTGLVTFHENTIPDKGQKITAGYEFDIPVRFDADEISVNLSHFEAGDIPSIPLVELLI